MMTQLSKIPTNELGKYLFPTSVPEALMKKLVSQELKRRLTQGDVEARKLLEERASKNVCQNYQEKMKAKEAEQESARRETRQRLRADLKQAQVEEFEASKKVLMLKEQLVELTD